MFIDLNLAIVFIVLALSSLFQWDNNSKESDLESFNNHETPDDWLD